MHRKMIRKVFNGGHRDNEAMKRREIKIKEILQLITFPI
jgi:hypothetical protein